MTSGGLNVNHGQLETASQDLRTASKSISDRLDSLETSLAPLQAGWTGEAKESYRAAKAQWDLAITEMNALLMQAAAKVQTSNEEYRAADRRGAARF